VHIAERAESFGVLSSSGRRRESDAWNHRALMACPHLFPKQETLYPETGDFIAVDRPLARNHRAAVLLGLHASRRREHAAHLRVRAAHR